MSYIESVKTYTGNVLDEIFFRPMLKADSIQDLGIRMLYNMPLPTTIQLWSAPGDPLHLFDSCGWSGGSSATKEQKVLDMTRIKAEMAFSAHDYFSLVFENITSRADVNFEDLTGTELEKAETEIFRQSLQEAIRATMWIGSGDLSDEYNSFKGFMTLAHEGAIDGVFSTVGLDASDLSDVNMIYTILNDIWSNSTEELKSLKADGELAFFVTSEVYYAYEKYLESTGNEGAYSSIVDGRRELHFRGIPVIDMRVSKYKSYSKYSNPLIILVDKRNMVMALNTSDLPGAEVRMWYNPDEMENRQRAVFMIGCDFIDPNLVSLGRFL